MKKKIPALLWMLVVPAVLIAALGTYLKYVVLRPLELYQDEPVFAVPFLLISDEEMHELLLSVDSAPAQTEIQPTEPPAEETELPTEPPAEETEPPTEPSTEETQPSTEPPTEETQAPEPVEISESWFDDALFIGDSRTQGLSIFARLGEADYFCKEGMTVYNVQSVLCSDLDYENMDIASLLSMNTYGKVYINLGLNEIGYDRTLMLQKYQDLIDLIREQQPDAVIILQAIMTLSREKAESQEYFSLDYIHEMNQDIAELADGEKIRYIDVNEWIADEDGYLPEEVSIDGCHLYGPEYDGWAQWLMDNAATLEIGT